MRAATWILSCLALVVALPTLGIVWTPVSSVALASALVLDGFAAAVFRH